MKSKFLIMALFLLVFASCKKNQDSVTTQTTVVPQSSVPATVVNAFNRMYNGATQIEWRTVVTGRTTTTEFEVEFNHSNLRHTSAFDDSGNERRHGINCTDGPVPQVVLDAFRATHPNDIVYEWKLNNGNWKAHFKRGSVTWEATYSATGVLIKEEHD